MDNLKPCPFCGGTQDENGVIDHDERCFVILFMDDLLTGTVSKKEIEAAWDTRAERTCKQEERGWGTEGDHARVWLTCGHDCIVPTVQDLPNYCQSCGARVVEQ